MRWISFLLYLMPFLPAWAQENPKQVRKALEASREITRQANDELAADDFVDAEANYRRAISKSDANAVAPYNLGNAYYEKESFGEAVGRYKEAGARTDTKAQKHKAFHNIGNVFMRLEEYEKAVEAYKEALRNNPTDEETRYNLALAKEMLKKQQDEQQQNQEQQEDQEQEQDKEQEQEQNQDNNEQQGDNQDQQDQQGEDDQKEENEKGEGDRKEEQDRKPEDSKEQPEKPRPNQLSPQQIQNLLQAMENEEKKVKEKIDAQKVKGAPVKTEKDW